MSAQTEAAPNFRQALSRTYRILLLSTVMLTCAILLASAVLVMRSDIDRTLDVFARMVGASVTPALMQGDRHSLRDKLAPATGEGAVQRYEIVDNRGRMLASWERPGTDMRHRIERWASRVLWPQPIVRQVGDAEAALAQVRVFGSAAGIIRFLLTALAVVALCLVVALVATGVLARSMWARVIQPLRHVAEVARSVRMERAFHRRVPPPGLAEVDNLVHDFNALLAELQGWYTGIEQQNQELAWAATHDALTGLGNRVAFERQVETTIQHSQPDKGRFAVLYLDANRFKRVNDNYGHDAGDVVLQAVAERLSQCIRQADKAFRVGGDEFAIILAPPTSVQDVEAIIARLADGMTAAIILPDGRSTSMTLSIGYAVHPDHGATLDELVKAADRNMYRDKSRTFPSPQASGPLPA